ncbi:unnamed protein product [Cylindrotheca closterium]|uniref:Uncharacterized protein n=1 Tax=Cylindrotheca closterium TaxID=2856 RepID=A0AAD2CQQ8_9STRA|nr:unnamed protein product [Cylindrotheca closterium]
MPTLTARQYHPLAKGSLQARMSDRDEEALSRARNDARTDIRNLLTQRAIQSFLFLCTSVRDPHSVKWIEEFLDAHNQLDFHGTGAAYFEAFGGTWDAPLLAMMEMPKDVVVVSAKRSGKGHRGWSKNNPYLEDRYVEFNIDIDPVSLTSRILSVREQIATEWVKDLNVLAEANDDILGSYFLLAKEERSKREPTGTKPDSSNASCAIAFERTAVNILENNMNFQGGATASSPFRKGNFDLLYNLCTQASIHRLLREYKDDVASGGEKEARAISFTWLREFYVSRVEEFFDGNQRYGRADDLIEQLLLSSPSVVSTDDGKVGLADPMGLAEAIISKRREVVDEWKVVMTNVPTDHADGIRKNLLNKQMESWGSGPSLGQGFQ